MSQSSMNFANEGGILDPRVRRYHNPIRTQWPAGELPSSVPPAPEGAEKFTTLSLSQATIWQPELCTLTHGVEGKPERPTLVCDFGREIHGSLQVTLKGTTENLPVELRIRLGESLGEIHGDPTTDHGLHDFTVKLPWAGTHELTCSGFRFARIDLLSEKTHAEIMGVRAVSLMHEDPWLGSFESSDKRLNDIWQVAARTVHLCMQENIWDGIKRDRLVWAGDMHPEIMAILTVFGAHPLVPKSLNFATERSQETLWMNTMPTYSLWWLISWRDWWMYTGDRTHIDANRKCLLNIFNTVADCVDNEGREKLPSRFLDWSMATDSTALETGTHALMRIALLAAAEICELFGESQTQKKCLEAAERLKLHTPPATRSLQASALRALAGLDEAKDVNAKILSPDPTYNLSPFYGYYVLEARAMAGDHAGAIDLIRKYWGAMLDMGATSFWEHFDMKWLKDNPTRIDQWPVEGRPDIHANFGDHCYVGLRHSLCHGWSSGPATWLSRYVLGIMPTQPGYKKVRITPHLGDIQWARGAMPTPHGLIKVSHEKQTDGGIKSDIQLPEGVTRDR